MKKLFAVVGAGCVDIFASSAKPVIARDSNPGTVRIGFGGVGRNIAENLARLGQKADLFAAFGSDVFSSQMLRHTAESGVGTGGCLITDQAGAPYYISVNDCSGDLYVAVNDMDVCQLLTPECLAGRLSAINAHDAVILDANLSVDSIEYLAKNCAPPLFADAVSISKVNKLSGALPRLFAIHVNLREAQALLNESVSPDMQSLQQAACRLHGMGVAHVLITLGAQGAFLSSGSRQLRMDAFPVQTVNANGCGDAFCAAAFMEIAGGSSHETILQNALAAAALTAQSTQSVAEGLSLRVIRSLTGKARKQR